MMITNRWPQIGGLSGGPTLTPRLLKTESFFWLRAQKSEREIRKGFQQEEGSCRLWERGGSLGKSLRTASGNQELSLQREQGSRSSKHKHRNPTSHPTQLAADPPLSPQESMAWLMAWLAPWEIWWGELHWACPECWPWESGDNRGVSCYAVKRVVICHTARGEEHRKPLEMSTAVLCLPLLNSSSISAWLAETKNGHW